MVIIVIDQAAKTFGRKALIKEGELQHLIWGPVRTSCYCWKDNQTVLCLSAGYLCLLSVIGKPLDNDLHPYGGMTKGTVPTDFIHMYIAHLC